MEIKKTRKIKTSVVVSERNEPELLKQLQDFQEAQTSKSAPLGTFDILLSAGSAEQLLKRKGIPQSHWRGCTLEVGRVEYPYEEFTLATLKRQSKFWELTSLKRCTRELGARGEIHKLTLSERAHSKLTYEYYV